MEIIWTNTIMVHQIAISRHIVFGPLIYGKIVGALGEEF
jgi:hypothetical protein